MESKNIILAQTIAEFKFIKERVNENIYCLPLNLDLIVYCELNQIPYLNPADYLDNSVHKEGLIDSDNFLKTINLKKIKENIVKSRYKNLSRNYFNSIFFLKYLVNQIKKKENVKKIYLSGWKKSDLYTPNKNFILSEICKKLFKNIFIISHDQYTSKFIVKEYKIDDIDSISKKNIIFLNFNYNFKRILFRLIINRKKITYISFHKIKFFKRLIIKLLGIKIYFLKETNKNEKINFNLPNIKIYKKSKEITQLFNLRSNFFKYQLIDLIQRCNGIKKLISQLKPKLALVNNVRGVDGYLGKLSQIYKFNSICISHGTVAEAFGKHDKIYKKIIVENVFSGDAKYFALQTKIAKRSLFTHKIKGKPIKTGNIIFATNNNYKRSNKYILYAVTMKDFINYQFFGVEMYYEYFENLKKLDQISNKNKFKIIVKPHPSISYLKNDLQKLFPNLIFSNKKIGILLKKVFATISFSSSVIEDSICSKIPVILFDQWRRYKHCISCSDVKKRNKLVYYVNNLEKLTLAIHSIKNSKKFNYSQYLFHEKNVKKNIDNLLYRFT